MEKLWAAFRDGAPADWLRNSEIWAESTPVIVAIKIGQDTQICEYDKYAQERDAWSQRFDYSKIRYMTIALASHLAYVWSCHVSHLWLR